MRFVSYTATDGRPRVGLLQPGEIRGCTPGLTLRQLLEHDALIIEGKRALNRPTEVLQADATPLLPLLDPPSVRDFTGFLQHIRNVTKHADMPVDDRFPPFYFSNPAAIVGPGDDVPLAPDTTMFDFELEVAAVIGRAGSDVPVADAESHIAGYTIFCDWSARDIQLNEMPLRLGAVKSKDTATTLGPALVTPDELEPYRSNEAYALEMNAYVNGERVGGGRWDTIDWGFPDMIAYASRGTTLRPGDVLGSGTVPTGCLFEHYTTNPETFRGWLQPGDEVRLHVEELGQVTHRLVAASPTQRLRTGY